MPSITVQDLDNAKVDVDHIAQVATSLAANVTDRLGHVKPTVYAAVQSLKAFNPRGARVNGTTYSIKDVYTESGTSYLTVVPSFTSVSVSADLAAGHVVVFQGVTSAELAQSTGADRIGTAKNVTVQTALSRGMGELGRFTISDMPNFMRALANYDFNLRPELPIEAYGSSVFNGAAQPTPEDAPIYKFLDAFKKWFDPDDRYNIVIRNRSIDGSTISTFLSAWEATRALFPAAPVAVVMGYNMNDCAPAQFNGGQTLPGFQQAMLQACQVFERAGCDGIFTTSPYPMAVGNLSRYAMPSGIPQVYPASAATSAPVSPEQLSPPASESMITADILNEGVTVSIDFRMHVCNETTLQIAGVAGLPVINSGGYWVRALSDETKKLGSTLLAEQTFYASGENVHPNPVGIQVSYGDAFDDFWRSMAQSTGQVAKSLDPFGYVTINPINTAGALDYSNDAVLDINIPYLDGRDAVGDASQSRSKKPLKIKTRTGAKDVNGVRTQEVALSIDPQTSDLVQGENAWRRGRGLSTDRALVDHVYDAGQAYGVDYLRVVEGNPATPAGVQFVNRRPFPVASGGKLVIVGRVGGGSVQVREYLWSTSQSGALTLSEVTTASPIGSGVFTVAGGGNNLGITTPVSSSVRFTWEAL